MEHVSSFFGFKSFCSIFILQKLGYKALFKCHLAILRFLLANWMAKKRKIAIQKKAVQINPRSAF